MKALPLDLTADIVSSYDKTKTTVLGRAAKKTLSALQGGKVVVGTPLVGWTDTITDAVVTTTRTCVSDNGHELQFVASTAGGVLQVVLYDVNETTGVRTYVGKITLQLPATTHTVRGVRLFNDSGASGWIIMVTTIGTTAALGGLFSAENIAKADFAPSIPTPIPVATAAGQKAVYWHQETGGTNNLTVAQGFGFEKDTGLSGTKIVVANGLVATPNFYNFDMGLTIVTVLAGGITTDWYVSKTGTIAGLVGTFLLLNNYSMCVPDASSGAPVSLQGSTCLFVPGSTGFGLGKISELSSGATTWPSYSTADVNNVPNTSVAQLPATAHYSQTLQRVIAQLNSGRWFIKKFMTGTYELEFGSSENPQYRTNQPLAFYEFGGTSVTSTYEHAGWLYTVNAVAGQIGGNNFDLRSLYQYDFSSIISKVVDIPLGSQIVSFSVNSPIRSFGRFFYRTNLVCDFSDTTTGWTLMPQDRVLSAISFAGVTQIQYKMQSRMERDSSTIPLQIIEAHHMYIPLSELSDKWVGSVDNTSTGSPSRSAFRLVKTYTSVVPNLFFRAYDDSGVLVASADTVTNPSFFEYSTNNGTSWSPLGTIPNVALTTELRYNWASPPGVRVTVSIRES
jgi:hypothetical protein